MKSAALHFEAIIEILGINPYVLVNAERANVLKSGWKKPLPVLVQVNGQPDIPWRINMMPAGDGSFYLYLHEYVRKASGTKVGDRVKIGVAFDPDYRNGPMHPMPVWFGEKLEENSKARQAWEELPPSRQKEVLRYFAQLKSDEARSRNIEKALYVLGGNEGRFMGRDWKGGK